MVQVACPICREWIDGASEDALSARLQEHMVKTHELKGTCDLEKTSAKVCKTSKSGKLASVPFEKRMEEEGHRPEGLQFTGEDMAETVRCPICGETILGGAGEDLSFNLEEHMVAAHKISLRQERRKGQR